MAIKQDNKPITSKYLLEFTKQIILPEVRNIVEEVSTSAKNEILTSNDKLSAKVLAEKAGITIDLSKF